MSDWFQAFKEECQKHDATKARLAEAEAEVARLREVLSTYGDVRTGNP